MQIEYRTGDLFSAPENHLIHGCNCQGAYGSGVAGQMRRIYPAAYEAYRDAFEAGRVQLGYLSFAECVPHTIINACTQDRYGGLPGVVYVDYEHGIRSAFRSIEAYAADNPQSTFAMPLIGAGLAGGSWTLISSIIEEEIQSFTPVVYLFDGKIPQ